ncbi:MAG: CoA pyrophosphatase [Desulfobacterota bacterium]|nr:CoA pyrophosphatase [Thermodesulfobacteriota bacterium]
MEDRKRISIDRIIQVLSSRERRVIDHPPNYARAAVLVPLFQKDGSCHLLLTKRTDLVKYHKGEISFPGGMVDEKDASLEKTALREAYEEIGLREEDVQILGTLDDILTVTQFIVTPFVGLFPYPYPFRTSAIEIAELIEVPLSFLLKKENLTEQEITRMGRREIVPAYQYGPHTIWGATARILKQFLDLISTAEKEGVS